jgi:L-ascorbate metabolism protein UlaG (beta-lactamase superfamily)
VIEDLESTQPLRIFFSGDGGYFDGFRQIGRQFGLRCDADGDRRLQRTLALCAHAPRRPCRLIGSGRQWLLPIHNGTFNLAMHAWWDPFERVVDLAEAQVLPWPRR